MALAIKKLFSILPRRRSRLAAPAIINTDHLARIAIAAAYAGAPVIADPADLTDLARQMNDSFVAVKKLFEDFKAANDQNIQKRDVLLDEKIARINTAMSEAEKRQAEAVNALNAHVARITAGGGGGNANDNTAKHAAAFIRMKMLNGGRSHADVEAALSAGVDVKPYMDYTRAFIELVAVNMNAAALRPEFQAALQVGADPSGGYLVPVEMADIIKTRLFETSPMRSIADQRTIGVDIWEQLIDVNDGTSGGWVAERAPRPATATPTIGMQEIRVHEQYAYPEITQKMLEDAVRVNAQNWLGNKTTDKMVRVENTAFVTGNGLGKPRGFMDYRSTASTAADKSRAWGVLQYFVSGAAAGFPVLSNGAHNTDALINLVYGLKAAYRGNAAWAMNRLSVAEVRKLKDNNGNYLWAPGIQAGQPASLMGYRVAELEDMPDFGADAFPIAFGDFRAGYTILDRLGFNLLVDPYTNKPYVGFYIRRRVGGDVTDFDAIKLLKLST